MKKKLPTAVLTEKEVSIEESIREHIAPRKWDYVKGCWATKDVSEAKSTWDLRFSS